MNLGCSSFSWQTNDGKHLLGRTCDMDSVPNSALTYMPRGYQIKLNGRAGQYSTKNAVLGYAMDIEGMLPFIDGVNEAGLMGCLLFYPGFAHYDDYTNNKFNINPINFLTYLLGEFNSADELCRATDKINLVDEQVLGGAATVHFILSDRSGETVIIEPDESGLSVHRDTIGVMTNSPNYEWHKQNLRNYLGMGIHQRDDQQLMNFTAKPFGEGTGLIGLPGDYTPPSRFVRVAYLKSLLKQQPNEQLAVSEMLNIFAAVNIPMGLHVNRAGADEGTLYTSIMCSESQIYYINTRSNHRLMAVDLNTLKDVSTLRRFDIHSDEDINWLV